MSIPSLKRKWPSEVRGSSGNFRLGALSQDQESSVSLWTKALSLASRRRTAASSLTLKCISVKTSSWRSVLTTWKGRWRGHSLGTEESLSAGALLAVWMYSAQKSADCFWAVSYTHLTLPTNRE